MRSDLRAARYILRMAARTEGRRMAAAALALLVGYVAIPLVALGLKLFTDDALAGHVVRAEITGALTAALLVAELMLGHFAYFAYTELGERLEIKMTGEIMQQINGAAGIEWHERADLADRLALLFEESWRTQLAFAALLRVAAILVQFAVSEVLLALIDPWLLLLPLAAAPLLLAGRRGRDIVESARERTAGQTRLSQHLASLATRQASNKEIRLSGLEDELISRHVALWQATTRELWRAQRANAFLQALGHLCFAIGYGIALYLAATEVLDGRATLGSLVLIVIVVWTVSSQLALGITQFQTVHASGRHIDRLMWLRSLTQADAVKTRAAAATVPMAAPDCLPAFHAAGTANDGQAAKARQINRRAGDGRTADAWRLRTGIELDHVSFTYPGTTRQVLAAVNLTLPARSTVALVGENGAGKSTLVKLLCRLYEPTSGRILADGLDIAEVPVAFWRGRTSALFQDFARFQLRLRDDVGAGELADLGNDQRLLRALAQAEAADLTPMGGRDLNDPIGHEYTTGRELSGGQWQKVALARARMRQAPVLLVLDEPASALDAEAEYTLFHRYAGAARQAARLTGAITLMVSHRFSTVQMADLIVVLADGKITECGTHSELVTNGGLYQELYTMKSRAYR